MLITNFDMMLRSEQVLQAPIRIDSPQSPFVGAKRIMAIAYPIAEGVTFKPVAGFPDYCVGNDGSVWSFHSGEWKKRTLSRSHNYYAVALWRNGNQTMRRVSHLVLEAFVSPRPPGMEACHFPDKDTRNNRVDNLRWDTRRGNSMDKFFQGTQPLGIQHHRAKVDEADVLEIRRLVSEGYSRKAMARRYGLDHSTVSFMIARKTWKHI